MQAALVPSHCRRPSLETIAGVASQLRKIERPKTGARPSRVFRKRGVLHSVLKYVIGGKKRTREKTKFTGFRLS